MKRTSTFAIAGALLHLSMVACSPVNFESAEQASEQDPQQVSQAAPEGDVNTPPMPPGMQPEEPTMPGPVGEVPPVTQMPPTVPPVIPPEQLPPEIVFPERNHVASAAFEDNYPQPGDADYNDFIFNFKVIESIEKGTGNLQKITFGFLPRATCAGFTHQLILVMDGQTDGKQLVTPPLFNGGASIVVSRYDLEGNLLGAKQTQDTVSDLTVFQNTQQLFKNSSGQYTSFANCYAGSKLLKATEMVKVEITLTNPELNRVTSTIVDLRRYRIMLKVLNTGQKIDLVDVDPKLDGLQMPFGLVIPDDWRYPMESKDIRTLFPDFLHYADFLRAREADPTLQPTPEVATWYDRPDPAKFGQYFDVSLFY